MADPKGLVYQGREGTGFAQIFQAQPGAFETTKEPLRNMVELRYQQLKEQKRKEEEQKAALAKLADYTPYLQQNKQELEDQYEKLRQQYVMAASQGKNPDDPTTEAGKEFLKLKADFNNMLAMDKQMYDEWGKQQQVLAQGKHDATQFADTWGNILKNPSIQGRFEALRGSTPLVLNINPLEGIEDYIPESVSTERRVGAGTETITAATPESIETNAKLFVTDYPEKVDYLKKKGIVKTEEEAVEYYKGKIEERTKRGTSIERGPAGGGGVNVSVGSGGATIGDVSISGAYSTRYAGAKDPNTINIVTVRSKGKDIAPMALKDGKGNSVYVKPENIVKKVSTGEYGEKEGVTRWYIEGKKAKRSMTGEQVRKEADAKNQTFEDYIASQGLELDPQTNQYVDFKTTETVYLPFDKGQGALGESNYNLINAEYFQGRDFVDVVAEMERKRGASGSTPAKAEGKNQQSENTKQVPISTIKGLVGKKGYEGYTEQELIDYYTSQGYKIVK